MVFYYLLNKFLHHKYIEYQCVPLNILRFASDDAYKNNYKKTLDAKRDPVTMEELVNATNALDPLSFWTYR